MTIRVMFTLTGLNDVNETHSLKDAVWAVSMAATSCFVRLVHSASIADWSSRTNRIESRVATIGAPNRVGTVRRTYDASTTSPAESRSSTVIALPSSVRGVIGGVNIRILRA